MKAFSSLTSSSNDTYVVEVIYYFLHKDKDYQRPVEHTAKILSVKILRNEVITLGRKLG